MVINGGSRSGLASYTGYLGWHLQRRDTNEFIHIREMAGVLATDLTAALDEMAMMGAGSRSKRPLYHANIDWKHDERLTPAQKARAVDRLADELELTGQPRIVVEHMKEGREHLHVVWLRIDPETGKAIPDSHNFRRHEIVARDLEREFGLERVQGVHIERDDLERPQRTPPRYEFAQADRSGIPPAEAKAELRALWQAADTGQAFAAALADAGWSLARGDRRDVLVALDPAGESYPINKRLTGLAAAEVRAKLADLDAATLPGVDEARQAIRDRVPGPAEPQPVPVPDLGGAEVAAPIPEATQRPSYEVEIEPPPDFEARFGPSEAESASPATSPEPPYVPNFLLVVDLDAMMEARFGPPPEPDLQAGPVIDATPEPPADLAARFAPPHEADPDAGWVPESSMSPDELARLDWLARHSRPVAEDGVPHLDTGEAVRRQEPAHGPQPSAADADARRAMEELARTDPLGMAARHGFHAGDRLKAPEDMRRDMAMRMRGFAADPQSEPSRDFATRDPAPELAMPDPGRLARAVAAARDRLADLAHRLDAAFGRVRDQVLGHETAAATAAAASRPTSETPRPQPTPDARPDPGRRLTAQEMADILAAPKREADQQAEREAEAKRRQSIWDDFRRRRMKRPGQEFEP